MLRPVLSLTFLILAFSIASKGFADGHMTDTEHATSQSETEPKDPFSASGSEVTTSGLIIFNHFMENPRSYGTRPADADIDTIVLHHMSAIYFGNRGFQNSFRDRLAPIMERPDIAALFAKGRDAYKFDWRFNKEILEAYGFSAHYLLERDGTVRRLVADEGRAFHAGASIMPPPDNREGVNDFSIGIEIIGSHPADDPQVASGEIPDYTEAQYDALHRLLLYLVQKHDVPLANIVGHDDIAGRRALALNVRSSNIKTDPGPGFRWDAVLQRLADTLDLEVPIPPRQRTASGMPDQN